MHESRYTGWACHVCGGPEATNGIITWCTGGDISDEDGNSIKPNDPDGDPPEKLRGRERWHWYGWGSGNSLEIKYRWTWFVVEWLRHYGVRARFNINPYCTDGEHLRQDRLVFGLGWYGIRSWTWWTPGIFLPAWWKLLFSRGERDVIVRLQMPILYLNIEDTHSCLVNCPTHISEHDFDLVKYRQEHPETQS